MVNVVDKVGVELEAAFDSYNTPDEARGEWSFTSDGSISTRKGIAREAVSVPMAPEKMGAALKKLEKHIVSSNKSMGFHVHVSLKERDLYDMMATPEFVEYFKGKLEEFSKQKSYSRIAKRFNNRFCTVSSMNEQLIKRQREYTSKSSERYKFLNFCENLHGTLEVRVFPSSACMNTLTRYTWFVVRTVNEYFDGRNFDKEWTGETTMRIKCEAKQLTLGVF